jgi:hyperosmotically inducible periplasmic protein
MTRHFLRLLMCISMMLFATTIFAETRQEAREVIKDSVITAAIKAKIIMDQSISVFHVDVSTKEGVVTLNGTVNSETQRRALVEIAKSTNGVRQIDTPKLYVVQSTQYFKDVWITAEIKGLFYQNKLFGKKNIPVDDISIETNNGVVYLDGKALSQDQADDAVILAKTVDGVKQVESRIRVVN